MCKLLIHPGDTYISCIINRNNKSECYYEGIGTVGEILSADDVTYYAKLENYRRFENNVPLTLPDGRFVEHLGRENTSLNPITSSRPVRLLKNDAFDYILGTGGRQIPIVSATVADCSKMEELLKNAIRSYFVGQTPASMFHIERISRRLGSVITVPTFPEQETDFFFYKPSSVAQTANLSSREIEIELQQAKNSLEAEKQRRETLESALHSIKALDLEKVEQLTAALSQAETRYQELLLQKQQAEMQYKDSNESYRLIERDLNDAKKQISTLESQLESIANQRNELQAAIDSATAHIDELEHSLANLEQQLTAETLLRKQAETALVSLEETLRQVEQIHLSETEAKLEQIAVLRDQLKSSEDQLESLQTALATAAARAERLSKEGADLLQRLQQETHRRSEAEAALSVQKESYAQSEHALLATAEARAADIAALREQIAVGEAQNNALQEALDESATRIEVLKQECSGLAQQRDAEILIRTQLESELNGFKEQRQLLENTHADENRQHSIDIGRLERKILALAQQNERLEQDLRTSEYRALGVCRHCGGAFTGLLRKKCSACGRIKDY